MENSEFYQLNKTLKPNEIGIIQKLLQKRDNVFLSQAECLNLPLPIEIENVQIDQKLLEEILPLITENIVKIENVNLDGIKILPQRVRRPSLGICVDLPYIFENVSLKNVSLKNAEINAIFIDCDFSNSNLFGAKLSLSEFEKCNFDNANLRNAQIKKGYVQFIGNLNIETAQFDNPKAAIAAQKLSGIRKSLKLFDSFIKLLSKTPLGQSNYDDIYHLGNEQRKEVPIEQNQDVNEKRILHADRIKAQQSKNPSKSIG